MNNNVWQGGARTTGQRRGTNILPTLWDWVPRISKGNWPEIEDQATLIKQDPAHFHLSTNPIRTCVQFNLNINSMRASEYLTKQTVSQIRSANDMNLIYWRRIYLPHSKTGVAQWSASENDQPISNQNSTRNFSRSFKKFLFSSTYAHHVCSGWRPLLEVCNNVCLCFLRSPLDTPGKKYLNSTYKTGHSKQ